VDPTIRLGLETMAHIQGYPKWKSKEIACSNWESRPLSWDQLYYAALDALMGTRIFWRMLMGSQKTVMKPISSADLRANIETFVEPVCKRVPISLLDKEQRIAKIAKLKREGLYPGFSWDGPVVKPVSIPECHERSSSTGGSTSEETSGLLDETRTGGSTVQFSPDTKRGNFDASTLIKGFSNEPAQIYGVDPWRSASKSHTPSELPLLDSHKLRASADWKKGYSPSEEHSKGGVNDGWGTFHLPMNVATELAN